MLNRNTLHTQRQKFHTDLIRYLNGGALSRLDLLVSGITMDLPLIRNSHRIIQECRRVVETLNSKGNESLNIAIESYKGANIHALKMMAYLSEYLQDELVGAYVHGSLGTYEEMPYSDFDGLVVIKNKAFDSPKKLIDVARRLIFSQSIMYDFDPLQHHGWFVLTEAQLNSYPEHYFPVELFQCAKSLFPDKGLKLQIRADKSLEKFKEPFDNLSKGIVERIDKKEYPKNLYQLKGLLSQFMLLPSIYVQARDKKGIFKKESFGAAKVDFSSDEWSIMDEVSLLRLEWRYEISTIRKSLITRPSPVSRFLAKRYSPAIPGFIKKRLSNEFYQRIKTLAIRMQENLQ